MYTIQAAPIECIMFALWPHKYKVAHFDLILKYHLNLLNSPEIPEFSWVSHQDQLSFLPASQDPAKL